MGVQVKKMLIWLLRRWKWVLWVLAVLVSLGIFHGMCRGDQKLAATLTAQTAWQRWETEDKPYAQASVYLPEKTPIHRSARTPCVSWCKMEKFSI